MAVHDLVGIDAGGGSDARPAPIGEACLNCGATLQGSYCAGCGQKQRTCLSGFMVSFAILGYAIATM